MYHIEWLSSAIIELEDAVAWYEAWSQSAADRFIITVDECISILTETPYRFPKKSSTENRFSKVKNFSYQIFIGLMKAGNG